MIDMKYYVDAKGAYLGAWDLAQPEPAVEVSEPPQDGRQVYDFASNEWTPIPASVPTSVTMRQARLALHSAGLLSQVEAAIEALPEPNRTVARIEWDYASEVHRASKFVALLGAALDLDKQSLDDLFLKASEL